VKVIHIKALAVLLTYAAILLPVALSAETVAVHHTEGLVHGFLVLRNLQGELLADGDLVQVAHGVRVTNHLVFHFKDGSIYDDTVVFSQHRTFQLISDHLIQRGPAFKNPMDVSIDAHIGQVTVRYQDGDGNEKTLSKHLDLPPDVSNGMVFTLLENIAPSAPSPTLSMVVATPKPRVVKLLISSQGKDAFIVGSTRRTATHYVVKIQIGGIAGLVAPLVGKQPPDTNVWILEGEAPVFLKSEGPLFEGGPVWRIELASPVWPK
jgi:hypothetical protein